MTGLDEHREECVGDVVSQHRSKPAISGGTANHRFRATEERDQVQVKILAREGEREPAGAKVFLGTEVIAGEGERRLGRGADEGKVDDPPDPGGSRSVDCLYVLLHAVLGLPCGDEQQRGDALESRSHAGDVGISTELRRLRAG